VERTGGRLWRQVRWRRCGGAGGEPAGWADGGGAGVPDGVLARVDPEGRTGRGGYGGINCR
jgi:hypothetical protein